MSLPIVVKHPGVDLPELGLDQMRYVLSRDGLFLERSTALFRTCARVEQPPADLDEHRAGCLLFCGKLPAVLVRTMLGFFRAAYRMHEGEAALVLLYHPQQRRFRWHCPSQTVEAYRSYGRLIAHDSIEYELPLEVPGDYVILGDAHSHGELTAFPSGVDKRDEAYKDGLHIIVGRIDRPGRIDYHVDFVMDGQRFTMEPADVLEDLECEPFERAPRSWLKRIHIKEYTPWFRSYYSTSYGTNEYGSSSRRRSDERNDRD